MLISPARLTQAKQLAEVEQTQPLASGWGESGFKGELGLACSIILTAVEGDFLSGFICARYAGDAAEIVNFAVRSSHARRGIGRELLSALLARLASLGVRGVTLEVNEQNSPAIHLYTQAGFNVLNKRKEFYGGQDALLMGKTL